MADNGRIINMETSLVAATSHYYSAYAGSKAHIKIEAFPSHHLDAMRGLPNVSFILDSDMLFSICLYGESLLLSSCLDVLVAAIFKFFQKFEPTAPGSISIILIPNGSSSYCIDS